EYYVRANTESGRDPMVPFIVFQQHIKSFEIRNQRLQLRLLSLMAERIRDRCKGLCVDFDQLMAVDFILFMRSKKESAGYRMWWPDTLIFAGRFASHFEIFARAKSTAFFNKIKTMLGVNNKEDLEPVLSAMEIDRGGIPRWEFDSFNPRILLGYDTIATK